MPRRKSKQRFHKRLNYKHIPLADYVLAGVVLGLTLFGILMVYNTGVVVAFEEFGDQLWFLKNQSMWAILGISIGFVVSGVDYRIWKHVGFSLVVISIVLLVLVLIPGFSDEVYGARQRLILPGVSLLQYISVQPSELVKLALIIYLASLFSASRKETKSKKFPHLPFLIVTSLSAGLTALEPDLGGALLIAGTAFVIYFTAGAPIISVVSLSSLAILAAVTYTFSSEYRRQRILTFLNPLQDPQGISYQIIQILIALGSGGFLGLGLGNSRQKFLYIPEVTTDSIFAIIGEELGFVGAIIITGALFFIVWRGLSIAEQAKDKFGQLLAIGISTNIGIQGVVNLGGMVGLLPLTGVPLPFISYGGSSLTLLLVSVGILLSISRSINVKPG